MMIDMNIFATTKAKTAWLNIPAKEKARTLAATYFAPAKLNPDPWEDPDNEYKKKAVEAIVQAADLQEYYGHWQKLITAFPQGTYRAMRATLNTRMLVNLSGSILENASTALEHVCGVPIIPGSAVKGAARRYAIAMMRECDGEERLRLLDDFINIFGCAESDFESDSDLALVADGATLQKMKRNQCGKVCFLQAVPGSSIKLVADVLTPHHSKYMGGKLKEPHDSEKPIPSYFPAVQPGKNSTYTFVLYANGAPNLLDTAEEWLTQAITLFGIGAKTSAGYGYFTPLDKALSAFSQEQMDAMVCITKRAFSTSIKNFFDERKKKPANCWALVRAISLPESDEQSLRNEFIKFLENAPPKSDKGATKSRKRALTAIQEVAAKHNITIPTIP